MTSQFVEYGTAGHPYQGYLSFPRDRGRAPCVFVIHDWSGVSDATCAVADEMAKLGYVAFAIDLYGKGRRGSGADQSAELMRPFVEDRAKLLAPMALALELANTHERIDAQRLAAVGFCFGGMCALDLARRRFPFRGVVSVHGVPSPIAGLKPDGIASSVLVLQGSDDPLAPSAQMDSLATELSTAGADWQMHVFGGVQHAFTNPAANDPASGIRYDATAHKRARKLIADFLSEVLEP